MDALTTNSSTAPALHRSAIPQDAYWPTILAEIEEGRSLTQIMATPGFPRRDWAMRCLRQDAELRTQYEDACKSRAIHLADELLQIADAPIPEYLDGAERGAHVALRRLQIDSRKWLASKFFPRYFGDKTAVEVTDYRQISIVGAMSAARARLTSTHRETRIEDVESRLVDDSSQRADASYKADEQDDGCST